MTKPPTNCAGRGDGAQPDGAGTRPLAAASRPPGIYDRRGRPDRRPGSSARPGDADRFHSSCIVGIRNQTGDDGRRGIGHGHRARHRSAPDHDDLEIQVLGAPHWPGFWPWAACGPWLDRSAQARINARDGRARTEDRQTALLDQSTRLTAYSTMSTDRNVICRPSCELCARRSWPCVRPSQRRSEHSPDPRPERKGSDVRSTDRAKNRDAQARPAKKPGAHGESASWRPARSRTSPFSERAVPLIVSPLGDKVALYNTANRKSLPRLSDVEGIKQTVTPVFGSTIWWH